MKVKVIQYKTCGDFYCTGHGVQNEVYCEMLKNNTFKYNNQIFKDEYDLFNENGSPREFFEVIKL